MEAKLEELEMILERIKVEVEGLKEGNVSQEDSGSSTTGLQKFGYKDLVQKVDRLEGTAGVEKVIITDVGERVQVIVQTPLGSVLIPLHHTANTSKAAKQTYVSEGNPSVSTGSGTYATPAFAGGMKGAPSAGMTPEQLQDFKKQTLQITQLQTKIKELEGKLCDANTMIKKGDDTTHDLVKREVEDVKEIYLYLDNINSTMSEKIASQRMEMEKIAGDTPQPVNYDPFNYGEAYAGDIVDFEARKRIVELKLLLQSLQVAMNTLKESVKVSPEIDLGYKVIRLDHLIEATGFGQAVKNGELTSENGLMLTQSSDIEPPEKRYPKLEAFQTQNGSDNKETPWAMTDSIMQTMYRLEVELGVLQRSVENMETGGSIIKECDPPDLPKTKAKQDVDTDAETPPQHTTHGTRRLPGSMNTSFADDSQRGDSLHFLSQHNSYLEKMVSGLTDGLKRMEHRVETMFIESLKRKKSAVDKEKPQPEQQKLIHPKVAEVVTSPDRHPVKLRHLLQRFFRYQVPTDKYDVYRLPTLSGRGYLQNWPHREVKPAVHKKYKESLASLLEPVCDEYMIQGQDGHYYRGDKAPPKVLTPAVTS